MNKYYLISYLVSFIITTSILFPVTAKSQDLPEAQRIERCQNNKNRIAELEKQLRVVNADLSAFMGPKERDDVKTHLAYVRTLYEREKDMDWHQYDMVSAQYNFKNKDCASKRTEVEARPFKCIAELEKIITDKLNKAATLQNKRPQLISRKNEIDNQLSAHRNNLVALRCDETSSAGTCTLAGKWVHNTEGIGTTTWTITRDGIATEEGKGYAKGKAAFDGTTLSIEWETTNGYKGTYAWKLDSNCTSYEGHLVFKTPITSRHKSTVRKTN